MKSERTQNYDIQQLGWKSFWTEEGCESETDAPYPSSGKAPPPISVGGKKSKEQKSQARARSKRQRDPIVQASTEVLTETELAARDGWGANAECLGRPVALWYPKASGALKGGVYLGQNDWLGRDVEGGFVRAESARTVCSQCPVATECLSYAVLANEKQGIWGGMAGRMRERLRKYLKETRPELLSPGCGTVDGYWRHIRRKEDVCVECSLAVDDG